MDQDCPIGEVGDEVVDLNVSRAEFAVEPLAKGFLWFDASVSHVVLRM